MKIYNTNESGSLVEASKCNSTKARRKNVWPLQVFQEVAKCCVFLGSSVFGQCKSRPEKVAGAGVIRLEEKLKIPFR